MKKLELITDRVKLGLDLILIGAAIASPLSPGVLTSTSISNYGYRDYNLIRKINYKKK